MDIKCRKFFFLFFYSNSYNNRIALGKNSFCTCTCVHTICKNILMNQACLVLIRMVSQFLSRGYCSAGARGTATTPRLCTIAPSIPLAFTNCPATGSLDRKESPLLFKSGLEEKVSTPKSFNTLTQSPLHLITATNVVHVLPRESIHLRVQLEAKDRRACLVTRVTNTESGHPALSKKYVLTSRNWTRP